MQRIGRLSEEQPKQKIDMNNLFKFQNNVKTVALTFLKEKERNYG